LSPEERLLAEDAVLQDRTLRKACAAAPEGKVLGIVECFAVEQGREAMRRQLELALQQEAAEAEKRGTRAEAVSTATSSAPLVAASRDRSSLIGVDRGETG
jgi:hypothetical protein